MYFFNMYFNSEELQSVIANQHTMSGKLTSDGKGKKKDKK